MGAVFKSPAVITVAAAGTAVALSATSQAASRVYISAPSANTGNMWIGDSTVLASTKRGLEIVKGTTQVISLDRGDLLDLNSIFVDAATSGDKVSIAYLTRTT